MVDVSGDREPTRLGQGRMPLGGVAVLVAGLLFVHGWAIDGIAHAQALNQIKQETPSLASPAVPTRAWVDFCERLPAECHVDVAEPATIAMNPSVWQTLVAVNASVNSAIKPVTDSDHWGVEDRWDYPDDGYGDCEDYQLLKRRQLVERGLPRRALRMAVVIDEEGAWHAVLLVRTDAGDLVLDNRTDAVLPWLRTGYVFLKREGDRGAEWVSLGWPTAAGATASR